MASKVFDDYQPSVIVTHRYFEFERFFSIHLMSHYSESLNNKLPMCPCSSPKDIPQGGKEASEEGEVVENGFEVLSADSGSDEEQDTLGAQGYVPLSQNEDETIAQDTIVVI